MYLIICALYLMPFGRVTTKVLNLYKDQTNKYTYRVSLFYICIWIIHLLIYYRLSHKDAKKKIGDLFTSSYTPLQPIPPTRFFLIGSENVSKSTTTERIFQIVPETKESTSTHPFSEQFYKKKTYAFKISLLL